MYAKFFIFAFLGATFLFAQQANAESNQLIDFIEGIKENVGKAIATGKEEARQIYEEANKKLHAELQERVKEFQARLEEARAQGQEKFEELRTKLQPTFEAEKKRLQEGLAGLRERFEAAFLAFNNA